MYVLGWRSTMIRRVCRSTFAAETQAMVSAVGEGEKLRAAIADMKFPNSNAVIPIRHLWLTDCESLYSYLTNPVCNGTEDKRLEIDLEDLRQMLWEDAKGRPKDDLNEQQIDKVRWIDTSTMLADPLTKVMSPDRLVKALDNGQIDLKPTAASTIAKMMKQKQRRKTRDDEQLLEDIGMTYDPNSLDLYHGEEDPRDQEGVYLCIDDKSHECETTLVPGSIYPSDRHRAPS